MMRLSWFCALHAPSKTSDLPNMEKGHIIFPAVSGFRDIRKMPTAKGELPLRPAPCSNQCMSSNSKGRVSSADKVRMGRITKVRKHSLRAVLVQVAWQLIRKDGQ